MDEKTPHLHLCFVPLTADGRLSAKEIIGNRKNLVRWQDEFWQHMVKQYPELERGESASQTGREHIPPRIFKGREPVGQHGKPAAEKRGNAGDRVQRGNL